MSESRTTPKEPVDVEKGLEPPSKSISLEELVRLGEELTTNQTVAGTTLVTPRLSIPTTAITDDFARTLYKIRANLGEMRRMCGKLGGSTDSHDLRAKLNALTEVTKEMIMRANFDLKKLSNRVDVGRESTRITRMTREFQQLINEFQIIQRTSLEKCREFVKFAHSVAPTESTAGTTSTADGEDLKSESREISDRAPLLSSLAPQQKQITQSELNSEIAYNEALIQEREQGIEEIEATIAEVQEIFGAMGLMVSEQQGYVDNIEANMELAAARTNAAVRELASTRDRRRSRRGNFIFLLFLVIFVFIIALAIINAII